MPLDTDYILTNSDYIAAKLGEADPDQAFRDAGVENGHEVFLDADIRVPLPLNSEATVPIVHAPAQVAEMETDEFEIDHVPRQMMLTTASPVRLGDSILPDFAGHATENAFVSQVPVAGGDFEGGAIALPTATVQTRAAVADIQIVGSAGRDPLASLCGRTVRLRASSMTGVFDALLDSGGNPIRVAAESVPVGANGEVAAYIPVTARAATGEIVILLMSQRNQLGFGGAVVDTQAPSFAVTVHRPVGRPLVRASGGVAHSV